MRSDQPRGGLVEYSLEPGNAVLTAAGVYASLWAAYGSVSDQLRCDRIPAVVSVEVGHRGNNKRTGYQCQYLRAVGDDNTRTWNNLPVTIDEDGIQSFSAM